MKFDMSRAWNEAVEMLRANREVLFVVAGLFFFIPAVLVAILLPDMQQPPVGDPEDPEAMMEAVMAVYRDNWWIIALTSIIQMIGTIALLALLRDSARPTVGDAIKTGALGFLPYLLAYFLVGMGVALLAVVLVGGLAAITPVLAALGGLIFFVLLIYIMVKCTMIGPVVAIEKVMNPVTAIVRSWKLTKGNSVRLFLFYLLLGLVYVVLAAILGAIFTLLGSALGAGSVALSIQGVLSGLLGAVATTVGVAVMASVHRQLSGGTPEAVSRTFD